MLLYLARKFCPLMSLALAFGCGKDITDSKVSDLNSSTQGQLLPDTLTLELDDMVSSRVSHVLDRDGIFTLPSKLQVSQGNGTGKTIKITYNIVDEYDFEFSCFYTSVSSTNEIPLDYCLSSDERDLGLTQANIEEFPFPMDQEKSIEMEVVGPRFSGLVISSSFSVDWK